MTDHRKPASDRVVKHMSRNEAVTGHGHSRENQEQPQDLVNEAGATAPLLTGIDTVREKAVVDTAQSAMIRRQIEMYREAQLLRQQLGDSFDP